MDELKDFLKTRFEDHDLLIEMKTVQRGMADEMRTIAFGISESVKDHERRLRILEKAHLWALGALGVVVVALKLFGGKLGI